MGGHQKIFTHTKQGEIAQTETEGIATPADYRFLCTIFAKQVKKHDKMRSSDDEVVDNNNEEVVHPGCQLHSETASTLPIDVESPVN